MYAVRNIKYNIIETMECPFEENSTLNMNFTQDRFLIMDGAPLLQYKRGCPSVCQSMRPLRLKISATLVLVYLPLKMMMWSRNSAQCVEGAAPM